MTATPGFVPAAWQDGSVDGRRGHLRPAHRPGIGGSGGCRDCRFTQWREVPGIREAVAGKVCASKETSATCRPNRINLTRYLASSLAAHNIRVNCLSPGGFQIESMPQPFVHAYCRRTLLGRRAEADDIKGPPVFLASDASRYIIGRKIPVDAGWTSI